jgi:hypothetical protein
MLLIKREAAAVSRAEAATAEAQRLREQVAPLSTRIR